MISEIESIIDRVLNPDKFLSLDDTDVLLEVEQNIVGTSHLAQGAWCFRLIVPYEASNEIARMIGDFGRLIMIEEPEVVLLKDWSEVCGGLILPSMEVFDHVLDLVSFDVGELEYSGFTLITKNGNSGLSFFVLEDEISGIGSILVNRIIVWGDKWCMNIRYSMLNAPPSIY